PTISLIGNSAIVYVTARSRSLRSPCNIFIGSMSMAEVLHMLGHYVMVVSHNMMDDHLMRQDICVYWQSLPILAIFSSSMLLVNIAIDRLMSTRNFYNSFIEAHYAFYIFVHVALGLAVSLSMVAWIFFSRTSDSYVLCTVIAPIHGTIYAIFVWLMVAISFFVPACYMLLFFLLKKIRLSQDSSRHIHKSLVVISLTTILSWFSGTVFHVFDITFKLDVNQLHAFLIVGIFMNTASAMNFFVYYFISTLYRREFDNYLLIGLFKKAMNCKRRPSSYPWATQRSAIPEHLHD
ncbi:hypothetical protein V3C99_007278, partial [Haemonchus contortus]|uniref:G_PROTEIN_RECEP_F1_2 domain-containing protein n=1 Tax=Haemonchus contortus TaxID=6289 RepID=A0A7I5EBN1_HAECO